MKTKLEVGKEYWLGEAKKFKGIYKGSFDKASYFDVTYGDANFTRDANGYVEFPERGVFEIEKHFHFTTPIAMKCTEEQFNGIKDRLVEMGYRLYSPSFDFGNRYLCTGFNNDSKCATDVPRCSMYFYECKPVIIESFNPDLFLALSAMTDKEDGIKGEVYTNSCGKFYTKDDGKEGKWHNDFWRKATAQEIIENFEKKEFVLPRFWHVVVTEENVDVLSKWRFGDEYPKCKLNIGYIVGFSSWQNSKQHNPSNSRGSFGSEITFDQFKKYVLKETEQSCQVIPIPPSKQATLFDDRVEITDWKPKEGQLIYYIIVSNFGNIKYRAEIYNSLDYQKESLANGFIKHTESEAKQLVEKLKQAML